MSVSYAEQATLTCPECGHAFTADIWHIVDASERPGLIERARDGTLHRITCPRCGHTWDVDAPLLIFTPPDLGVDCPPLLFSPAQQTSAEQDREHAAALVARLREALGERWQDEWVAQGVPGVPRDLLPLALTEGWEVVQREMERRASPLQAIARILAEAGDLGRTLWEFIAADTWATSRRIVEEHPELLTEDTDALLGRLIETVRAVGAQRAAPDEDTQRFIRMLEQHRSLLRRCREVGVERAFAEIGGLPVPPEFRADLRRAQEGEQRYLQTSDLTALDEAVAAWERILNHPAFEKADERFRLAAWNDAGGAYLRRYWATGHLPDLSVALDLWRQAVNHTREGSPDWASMQANLGVALRTRFEALGQVADLDAAIEAYQKALKVAREGSPDWARWQANLGVALRTRFEALGQVADLDAAIEAFQKALKVAREGSPDWARWQANLGVALSTRFEALGQVADLDAAIEAFQKALRGFDPNVFPDYALRAALPLGRLLFRRRQAGDMTLAAQVYDRAWPAAQYLYFESLRPGRRERELRRTQEMLIYYAYALACEGELHRAAQVLEAGRTRQLTEALLSTQARQRLGDPFLEEAWRRVQEALSEYHYADDARRVQAEERVAQARRAYYARLREVFPEFFESPTFEQIAQAAQDAHLVYLLTTPAGGLALIVHGDAVEVVHLDFTTDDLDALLVKREGDNVTGGYLPGQLFRTDWLVESLEEVLPRLGERVMGPAAEALRALPPSPATDAAGGGGEKAVILIPTGHLALLPLHAARYTLDGQEVHFLDEFDVAYAPSARALAAARRQAQARRHGSLHLVGVGNPLPHPKPLPYARAEMEEVAALFTGQATPLYEEAATKAALLSVLPDATHVHLACHGRFDLENPLNSHVQLAHQEPLTLGEIMEQESLQKARLVVLSACQTAITEFRHLPEEVIGLPTGLVQAGVPAVVGTLWPVDDLSTALLMVKFYEYYLHGDPTTGEGPMPPARALRHAQQWLRKVTARKLLDYFRQHKALHEARRRAEQKRMPEEVAAEGVIRFGLEDPQARPYRDPYYWAPFTFMGV